MTRTRENYSPGFLDSLAGLPAAVRVLLFLLADAVLVAAFFFLFYQPWSEEIGRIRAQKEVLAGLGDAGAGQAAERRGVAGVSEAVSELDAYALKFLSAEGDLSGLSQSVSELGARAGVKVTRFAPILPARPHEFYAELPFDLELEGPFPAMLKFLYAFSAMDRIAVLSDLEFTSPRMIADDLIVQARCKGSAYRALTAAETAVGAGN